MYADVKVEIRNQASNQIGNGCSLLPDWLSLFTFVLPSANSEISSKIIRNHKLIPDSSICFTSLRQTTGKNVQVQGSKFEGPPKIFKHLAGPLLTVLEFGG